MRPRAAALARRAARSDPGKRLVAALREEGAYTPDDPRLDGWLTSFFGERLAAIDADLGTGGGTGPEGFKLFRDLDDDLWALLLSRRYETYPSILGLLPELPEPRLQLNWNGESGLQLIRQSNAFYRHSRAMHALHSDVPLTDATVLDYGCGWGRLTRFFARDVEAGCLLGCDPVEEILATCRRLRVPAELARSEFVPERLPFEQRVDLTISFSVFTHISEEAARASLSAIHSSLNPGGLLVLTIRPPAYLDREEKMHAARDALGSGPAAEARYVFVPDDHDPSHPQYESEGMSYGETVVSLSHVREHWADLFELVDVKVIPEDLYQVAVTLRKR